MRSERDIDAEVARAAGWTDVEVRAHGSGIALLRGRDPSDGKVKLVPGFSTSIAAAWALADRWESFALEYDDASGIDHQSGFSVVYDGSVVVEFAQSAPLAICLAFLKTKQER